MARLTLSEQVNAQASQIATLTAELTTAKETIASHLRANELQQTEIVRLREMLQGAREAQARVEELTKTLAQAESMKSYHNSRADKADAELEQAHAVLDGVEGAPPRDYERPDGYGKAQRNVVTRLAGAFLAIAKTGGAK